MFESVATPSLPERLRSAALAPLIAFLAALAYFTIYPALTRVPAALFWLVVAILAGGTIAGFVSVARIAKSDKIRGRAIGWLIAALAIAGICARVALGMALPWL